MGASYIHDSNYSYYRKRLVTTIQVEEKTRDELFKLVAELERRKGRHVTYDEAIMTLMEDARRRDSARVQFRQLYGTLGPDEQAWEELRNLRRGEKLRLERIGRASL